MNLTFADPKFFWLAAILPLFVLLKIFSDLRGESLLKRAVAPRLLGQLREKRGKGKSWVVLGLEILTMLSLITALARPQFGHTEEEVMSSGRSLLIALDTSRSMLADDLSPNRLERAKYVLRDLIADLPTDRIGLIAFAGRSYLQVPLTQDHEGLLEMLDQTDTELIPRGGTNIASAIDLAVSTFTGQKPGETQDTQAPSVAGQAALLLFSDGDELEGKALAAAQRAAEKGVIVITVGVGTKTGGLIPDPETRGLRYMQDQSGKTIRTSLQEEILVEIARTTNGMYLPLIGSDFTKVLDKLQSSDNKSQTMKRPIERYRWPLCASLLFLIGALAARIARPATRQFSPAPAAAILLVLAGLFPAPARAADAIDPALSEASALFDRAKYEESAAAYEKAIPLVAPSERQLARLGWGAAAMKAGQFDKAATTFGHALLGSDLKAKELGHFNLANSIFEKTRADLKGKKSLDEKAVDELVSIMRNCIEHYDETLALNKDHASAKSNRDKVEEFLRKLFEASRQSAQNQQSKMDDAQKDEMVNAMKNLEDHYKKEVKKDPADKQDAQNQKEVQEFIKKLQEGEKPGEGQEKPGEKGKEGEGKEGEGKKNPGEKGKEGEGKEGDGEKGDGQKKEEADPKKPGEEKSEEKEDKRTEAEKAAEEKANAAANKELEGQVKAAGEEESESGKPEKPKPSETRGKKDAQSKVGQARAMLRREMEKYSDEKMIRPRMEEAVPDQPYKNW